MKIEVVTLFPEMVRDALAHGVVGRALERGLAQVGTENPRSHTHDVHQTVDDSPFPDFTAYRFGPESEREKFEPPPPAVADFPTQIARTWENSVRGMINIGKGIILWAVEWILWIPLLVLGCLFAWLILRAFIRRRPSLM